MENLESTVGKESTTNAVNVIGTSAPEGWQLCPKCYGQGTIPYYMKSHYPSDTTSSPYFYVCDVCNGKKIINIRTGLPPD
ncbi:MAG TPA: hypothetical protein PLL26_07430 [Candidatus Dojkabacteria bacterium]|nr:hypothetical protein [Candidatus Dojkabacteria bacterium]